MRPCARCGGIIAADLDLCDDCFTRWIRSLLIFSTLAVVGLVALAQWGAR